MHSRDVILTNPFTTTFVRIKAKQLCRRSDHSRTDLDDLMQDMHLYLLERAQQYDASRATIEGFVTNLIDTWVAMHLRALGREKREPGLRARSLERTMIEEDGDKVPLAFVLRTDDQECRTHSQTRCPIEEFETREAVAYAMQQLQPDERKVAILVGKHGIAGAARALGISRRQIRNALALMRQRFEDAGLSPE